MYITIINFNNSNKNNNNNNINNNNKIYIICYIKFDKLYII